MLREGEEQNGSVQARIGARAQKWQTSHYQHNFGFEYEKWSIWGIQLLCWIELPCKASSSRSTRASLHSVLLSSSRINFDANAVQVALMSSGVGILFMKVFLSAAPTEFISSSIAAFRAASRAAGDPNKHLWFTDG